MLCATVVAPKKYTYQPEKEIQLNIKVVVTNSS